MQRRMDAGRVRWRRVLIALHLDGNDGAAGVLAATLAAAGATAIPTTTVVAATACASAVTQVIRTWGAGARRTDRLVVGSAVAAEVLRRLLVRLRGRTAKGGGGADGIVLVGWRPAFVVVLADQTFDLEGLGYLEQRLYLLLGDAHLALVHVLEDGLDLGVADVLEHDDRMSALQLREQTLEIRGAGGQHHFVALDEGAAFAGQRHVREVLIAELLAQHRQQVGLMVVPPQTELLLHSRFAYHKCSLKDLWVGNCVGGIRCVSRGSPLASIV